jgi:hypothetical protein
MRNDASTTVGSPNKSPKPIRLATETLACVLPARVCQRDGGLA